MNFQDMTGYDFEDFVAHLLREKGFKVTQTSYSGDNGIDMIAQYNQPLFSGKYIIQCKNYTGLVGQPELRDLYGVVMSESANKGILITSSDFTEQAISFAEGKQLELINGDVLRKLMNSSNNNNGDTSIQELIECKDFNIRRYEYLKSKLDTAPKDENAYKELYEFLYDFICRSLKAGKYEQCTKNLYLEIISLINSWKKRCYSGKAMTCERLLCDLLLANIMLLSGEWTSAVNIILDCGKKYSQLEKYEEFWPYIVETSIYYLDINENSIYSYRNDNIFSCGRNFMAFNLYTMFKSVGFNRGIAFVTKNVKPIQRPEDYIERRIHPMADSTKRFHDMYTERVYGIHHAINVPSTVINTKMPNGLRDEVEKFVDWYKKYQLGELDDRFFLPTIRLCGDKNRHPEITIDNYQKSVISFAELRKVCCSKKDKDICDELNSVFDSHGIE